MKRRIISVLLSIVLILSLCSCGSTDEPKTVTPDTTEEIQESQVVQEEMQSDSPTQYNDEEFLADVKRGAEARWTVAGETPDSVYDAMSTGEYQRAMKELVDLEANEIKDKSYYSFQDPKLELLAGYIFKGIDLQYEGVQYLAVDDANAIAKCDATWGLGLYYRYYAYYTLYLEGYMEIDSSHSDALDAMSTMYATAKESVEVQEYVNETSRTLELTLDEEGSTEYYKKYTAIIENTTEYRMTSMSVEVNFLDKDGIIVGNSSDYIQNFKSGDKARVELSFDTSKGEFESYDVFISCYTG